MVKTNVQILFSDEEMKELEKKATQDDLTVVSYIRSQVLDKDDYGSSYKNLKEKVHALPRGTKFNIKSLFGVEWTMSKGVKLNLGKTYFKRVSEGTIKNVRTLGKDSSNTMWYEKI
ncbi:hypothetical protein J2W91_005398 [Paenibacillus amylolyticus]|uniref:Uncharacterized protein n=1 Tax=Paenibacillus amylolyticus TaxID=1451 RepID=A0AAP5LRU7_PAEAM|nr:single-stranded DNA-binding protein [Paenibacillus amylolyticus]MDR6726873.1 hypothetical protein [Paenibacillus amylolyticus]